MSSWEIFWAITIAFSVLSFSYMSARMLYFGLPELKEMFTTLTNAAHLRKENQE